KFPAVLLLLNAVEIDATLEPPDEFPLLCTKVIVPPPPPPLLITMLSALVAVWELLSLTCAVKLLVPVAVGVPEMTPLEELRDNPSGKLPEITLHVYGVAPPVAASVAL